MFKFNSEFIGHLKASEYNFREKQFWIFEFVAGNFVWISRFKQVISLNFLILFLLRPRRKNQENSWKEETEDQKPT